MDTLVVVELSVLLSFLGMLLILYLPRQRKYSRRVASIRNGYGRRYGD